MSAGVFLRFLSCAEAGNIRYGGVADANPDAYLASICNLDRIKNAKKSGDTPLWFGEWSLGTNFNANDTFTRDWADAQKMAFSQGAGWIVRCLLLQCGLILRAVYSSGTSASRRARRPMTLEGFGTSSALFTPKFFLY